MLTTGFAVALIGCGVVYLASRPKSIPKVVKSRVASVTDGPRMTQPWPWIRLAAVRWWGSDDAHKRTGESDYAIAWDITA
jgi:hypothetical protein